MNVLPVETAVNPAGCERIIGATSVLPPDELLLLELDDELEELEVESVVNRTKAALLVAVPALFDTTTS